MPIGLLVGSLMPWVPADKLGPVSVWNVVQPFLLIALPNLLFISALLFAVGSLTRKLFSVYVTGIALLLVWQISQNVIRNLDRLKLGSADRSLRHHDGRHRDPLLDRGGEEQRSWFRSTPYVLANRALWLGIAIVLFVTGVCAVPAPAAGGRCRPEEAAQPRHRPRRGRRRRRRAFRSSRFHSIAPPTGASSSAWRRFTSGPSCASRCSWRWRRSA